MECYIFDSSPSLSLSPFISISLEKMNFRKVLTCGKLFSYKEKMRRKEEKIKEEELRKNKN